MTFEIVRSLSKGQCPHSMADMFFWGYCTPGNNNRGNLSQFNDISPPFRSSNCPAQKMWISCLPTAVTTPIYGWVLRVDVTPFIQSYATRVMQDRKKRPIVSVAERHNTAIFFVFRLLSWMDVNQAPATGVMQTKTIPEHGEHTVWDWA